MAWIQKGNERIYFQRIVSSWDTAFESKSTADYSVGTIWGDTGKEYYLLDVVRGRWRFPQLKEKMKSTYRRWKEDSTLIEAKASGKDLLYELKEYTDLPVQSINPVNDKVARAAAISGRVQAGRVHIPKSAPWLRVFLTELEHFPKVAHDDQVDSFTQAIRWMTRFSGSVVDVV
jgi:predicted phage terminase large subunit-like protein